MTDAPKGSDLLIVDNSHERWKMSTYLKEWCEISKRFDIATGNFEIGGLLVPTLRPHLAPLIVVSVTTGQTSS